MIRAPSAYQGLSEDSLFPDTETIVREMRQFVCGQDSALYELATSMYLHYMGEASRELGGETFGRHHILLIGPTGCGKTWMVRRMADYLRVPFYAVSATALVEAGYVGKSLEDVLRGLVNDCKGDVAMAERAIVFIDEFDKLQTRGTSHRDVGGEGVQQGLLTIIEGIKVDLGERGQNKVIDTSKLLFVCAGAFTGLQEMVEARLTADESPIGFKAIADQREWTKDELYARIEIEDLIEFGFMEELLGRFPAIVSLKEMGVDELRRLLSDSYQESAIRRYRRIASTHGIELQFTDEALDAIALKAFKRKLGARALDTILRSSMSELIHRWTSLAKEGIRRVVIDRDCVEGTEGPIAYYGETAGIRWDLQFRHFANKMVRVVKPTERPQWLAALQAEGGAPKSSGKVYGSKPKSDHESSGRSRFGKIRFREEPQTHARRAERRLELQARFIETLDICNASPKAQDWWEEMSIEVLRDLEAAESLLTEFRNRDLKADELCKFWFDSEARNLNEVLYLFDERKFEEDWEPPLQESRDMDDPDRVDGLWY